MARGGRTAPAGRALALAMLLATAAAAPAAAQELRPADPAGLVVRVQRLEEEVARLRGRIEELEYALRRLEGRLAPGVTTTPLPPPATDSAPEDGAPPAVPATPTEGRAGDTAPPPAASAGAPLLNPATPADAAATPPTPTPAAPADAPAPTAARPATAPPAAPAAAGERDRPALDPQAAFAGAPEERYRLALDLLEAGRFDEAAQVLEGFLEDFPDHPKAPDAAFWLAETHFFRQDYATAAQLYARNYRRFGPKAPRAAETLLKLGMALAAIGERERACRTFAELEKRHPRAPVHIRQALARERAANRCP